MGDSEDELFQKLWQQVKIGKSSKVRISVPGCLCEGEGEGEGEGE